MTSATSYLLAWANEIPAWVYATVQTKVVSLAPGMSVVTFFTCNATEISAQKF